MALSNSAVAHCWAHGRNGNGGSLYSNDGVLRSYGTVIGKLYESKKGEFCIIDINRFSSTTSKHQGDMCSACSHLKRFFIPNQYSHRNQTGTLWEEELAYWFMAAQYIEILNYKDTNKFNDNVSLRHYNDALEYLNWTGGSVSKLLRTTNKNWVIKCRVHNICRTKKEISAIKKMIRAIQNGVTGSELVDVVCGSGTWADYKERTAGARKNAFVADFKRKYGLYSITYKEIQQHINCDDFDEWIELVKVEGEKKRKQLDAISDELRKIKYKLGFYDCDWNGIRTNVGLERLRELASLEDKFEAKRILYHEGYINSVGRWYNNKLFFGGNVLLRVVGNHVETSKNIKLSFEECKRIWRLVSLWHENSRDFTSDNVACDLSGYGWKISAYRNDLLYSGCHTIAYPEMEYIARKLNFIA